ncbi:hypothetical protein OHB26_29290 [Nocardia sp. NBC_01503]|uniref:hypothetical protein n=1 Tax=Nocardia sp. NBC_01503 TaxID=2975997 RepID=UPI002E7AEC3F|nr:hypothetical protein [Nocardia sp. NBC_01503]WTL30985.1 hypothetical protein OHB26_29290 [Nocardia sp. NBC_01503]
MTRCGVAGLLLATAVACSSPAGGSSAASASGLDSAHPGDTIPLSLMMFHSITWRPWHGTTLPFADRWGPTTVQGDVATGFSHTPEGAVIAMMQHQARLAGLDGAAWSAAARVMAVVAPADQPPDHHLGTGFDTGSQLPYFAGYHWSSYTTDRAEADLALQTDDGALNSVHVAEVWRGGDWKAELPAAGGTLTPLYGMDAYQPWPAVPR